MIFVWRGRGYLVFLAMLAMLVVTAAIESLLGFKDATAPTYVTEFLVAIVLFIPIWIYGVKWNAERREFIDKKTDESFVLTNQHRAFWIPMQYWAVITPALLLLIFAFATP